MFATCFYAILDPASGWLSFANAGHNLPYLSRAGEIFELRATGMPLGLMPEQSYVEFLLNELQDFTGVGWDQEDDVTLVILRKTV